MTSCIAHDPAHSVDYRAQATRKTHHALPLLLVPLLAAVGMGVAQDVQAIGDITLVGINSADDQGQLDSDDAAVYRRTASCRTIGQPIRPKEGIET